VGPMLYGNSSGSNYVNGTVGSVAKRLPFMGSGPGKKENECKNKPKNRMQVLLSLKY
jgi:hypothetical protein